jgi:hypothetical protein
LLSAFLKKQQKKMASASFNFLETKRLGVHQRDVVTKRAFIEEAFIRKLHADNLHASNPVPSTEGGLQDAINVGNGEGTVFKEVVNHDTLVFKTLEAGPGINIVNQADTVTISSTASGTGDVVGPSSATDGDIALFNGTSGKVIKDSKVNVDDNGVLLQFTDTPMQTRLSNYATLQTTVTWNSPGGGTAVTNVYFERLGDVVTAFIWGNGSSGFPGIPPNWDISNPGSGAGELATDALAIPVGFQPLITNSMNFADGDPGGGFTSLQLFATNGDPNSLSPTPPSFAFVLRRTNNTEAFNGTSSLFTSTSAWSISYLAA